MTKRFWLSAALLFHLPLALAASPDINAIKLRMHDGLPLLDIAVKANPQSTLEDIDTSRWFALQQIAEKPELLNDSNVAMVMAASFLPPSEWHRYMGACNGSVTCEPEIVGNRPPPYFLGGNAPKLWKGRNDADYKQAHEAFVADYRQALLDQAVELPTQVWLLTQVGLTPGNAETVGLRSTDFLTPVGKIDDPQRRLPIWNFYSASVTNRLPSTLSCAPKSCAELLGAHPDHAKISRERAMLQQYPVYLLAKVQLNKIHTSQMPRIGPAGYGGGSNESTAELVGDFQLFYDRELTKKFAALPNDI